MNHILLPLIFWTEFFRVLLAPPEPPRRSAQVIDFDQWCHDHPPTHHRPNGRAA